MTFQGFRIAKYDGVVVPAPPVVPAVEITAITLDKKELVGGEDFTISITFSNPSDYDVYVKPAFAFGKVINSVFTPEAILCGWDYLWNKTYDQAYVFDWVNLGHPQHPGTNMPQFVYDPDGIPVLAAGGYCWLKLPAKGQATTSRKWMVSGGAYGLRDVCVKVDDTFYLVYDPGWATRTVGGVTVVVNYRPVILEPFSGVVPGIATIGLPPEAVTIDSLEIQINYVTGSINMKITITNNTGQTLIDSGKYRVTRLIADGYLAEGWVSYGRTDLWKNQLGHLFHPRPSDRDRTGNIPPGTHVLTSSFRPSLWAGDPRLKSYIPPESEGYIHTRLFSRDEAPITYVYYADVHDYFEGKYSQTWQTWRKTNKRPVEYPYYFAGYYIPYTRWE